MTGSQEDLERYKDELRRYKDWKDAMTAKYGANFLGSMLTAAELAESAAWMTKLDGMEVALGLTGAETQAALDDVGL